MAEQEPREDQWPLYPIGPDPHMHALGVIAINFNLFEASLFGLFSFVLQKAGFSEEGSSALFRRLNNEQRLDVIKFGFQEGEYEDEGDPDPNVRDAIAHLIKYWAACFENRNHLMHARLRRIRLLGELFETDRLHLEKSTKKGWLQVSLMNLSLKDLRRIADEMHDGYDFAISSWWSGRPI
jgi:hypothetical protein